MKKLICVVALCLASPLTFADESSVKMVLDSAHSKGFVGCDDKIRETFKGYEAIHHVEVKMPFLMPYVAGENSVALDDEVIVIVDWPGNAKYGIEGGITSDIFRKTSKGCIAIGNFNVRSVINSNCQQLAHDSYSDFTVVAETETELWVRPSMETLGMAERFRVKGAEVVYTPLRGGGCRLISLPNDSSEFRKK